MRRQLEIGLNPAAKTPTAGNPATAAASRRMYR